ncbi:hypothetical protein AA313_de0204983 [Arthrobotrys entomopaga]|nr:hypothetical protein AA313_de0204983 [Arthrobotrys entomopaga]
MSFFFNFLPSTSNPRKTRKQCCVPTCMLALCFVKQSFGEREGGERRGQSNWGSARLVFPCSLISMYHHETPTTSNHNMATNQSTKDVLQPHTSSRTRLSKSQRKMFPSFFC